MMLHESESLKTSGDPHFYDRVKSEVQAMESVGVSRKRCMV